MIRKVLVLSITISSFLTAANSTTPVRPYLPYRSQGANLTKTDVGMYPFFHKDKRNQNSEACSNYGIFSVVPGYSQSFDSKKIAQSLFGWWLQKGNKLVITGSDVPNRNDKDLLADWFYLDGAYQGTIAINPKIRTASMNLDFYAGLDELLKGLYVRVDAPLTWSKWEVGACFKTTQQGTLTQGTVTRLSSAQQFFCKKKVALDSSNNVLYHGLTSGRFCGDCCNDAKTKTRLADIRLDVGWDFIRKETYRLGAYARGVIPTGNRPHGSWLLEPMIGNGKHFELGAGLTAQAALWRNEERTKSINFMVDAYVTHMFGALQGRVFDLKNMPLSRYLTAFRSNQKEMIPVANLTATTIKSSFAAQGEILALFNATLNNWMFDLGYNFWAQSCEKITCSHWANNCYGKGIIKNGYNVSLIDASKWAVSPYSTPHTFVPPVATDVILPTDIDYDGARTKGMSHKVFGNIGYAWMDREVVPFIGVGGEGEFGRNDKVCSTSCSKKCCSYVSLSQWGVWLKGGVSF